MQVPRRFVAKQKTSTLFADVWFSALVSEWTRYVMVFYNVINSRNRLHYCRRRAAHCLADD